MLGQYSGIRKTSNFLLSIMTQNKVGTEDQISSTAYFLKIAFSYAPTLLTCLVSNNLVKILLFLSMAKNSGLKILNKYLTLLANFQKEQIILLTNQALNSAL